MSFLVPESKQVCAGMTYTTNENVDKVIISILITPYLICRVALILGLPLKGSDDYSNVEKVRRTYLLILSFSFIFV